MTGVKLALVVLLMELSSAYSMVAEMRSSPPLCILSHTILTLVWSSEMLVAVQVNSGTAIKMHHAYTK